MASLVAATIPACFLLRGVFLGPGVKEHGRQLLLLLLVCAKANVRPLEVFGGVVLGVGINGTLHQIHVLQTHGFHIQQLVALASSGRAHGKVLHLEDLDPKHSIPD